jgi:DEAD/DEAH box helicase domain-containing protein
MGAPSPTAAVALPEAPAGRTAADALLAAAWGTPDRPGDPGRLVHLADLPARPARFADLARPLPDEVSERAPGALWSHQAQAIDLARAGRSVVVATGTASGKSLSYQLPIAEAATTPVRPGTALAVFPTKALAHDQLRALSAFGSPGVVAGAYDGDAGPEERAWIRRNATVVLTNPEMLHAGLLPHHERWATFLGRLRYVVVDELHVFRGVFGSHVAHLLRRLRRVAAHHGADPTFIGASATIGDPGALAAALWGDEVDTVEDDGSPRGPRSIAVWQPPVLDEDLGTRASAHGEAAGVMAELVRAGHRTLGFCRSRRSTEVVAADVRRRLPRSFGSSVVAYRAGYLAEERRSIEDALAGGRLAGVVATSALELGVDIGGLDAVVLDGFPGTIASFWQQAGRAGREQQPAAAVLVAGADQLDQWLATHPEELLTRAPEPAVINPANPFVADPHLRCAAHELPLTRCDERWWPGLLDDAVRRLVLDDELAIRRRHRRGRSEPLAVFAGTGWPSHAVSLRSAGGRPVRIVAADDGRLIGDVDRSRAPSQVHPGAVYLHQGQHHRVIELDLDDGVAVVEPHDGATTTIARTDVDIELLDVDARRTVGRAGLHLGPVEVTTRVVGYQIKDVQTGDVLGHEALDLPPSCLRTRALWYVVDDELLAGAGIDRATAPSALHAAEHAAIGMLPLFAICDRWDVGGVSTLRHAGTGAPTVVIYDAVPGGAGVAELGFSVADRHLTATLASIEACPCTTGCPSCVQSPKCGNANEQLDKVAAIALLRAVLEP